MSIKTYDTITEAYMGVLKDVYENPEYVHYTITPEDKKDCDNSVTQNKNWYFNKAANQEKINYHFIIKTPSDQEQIITKSASRNKIIYDYSEKETILFDNGDCVNIKTISKVWERIQNPDGTINANYGTMAIHLRDAGNSKFGTEMMTQWEWAKNRLKLLKKTNQAYLHFNRPKDQWNENLDQPCCMFIQFQIRDDKLNLIVNYRSNDACYGLPYNILYLVKLMHRMKNELLEVYPLLTVGDYYYNATSVHIYLKHLDKVRDMLGIVQ